jgi:hypothetical protein
MAAVRQFGMQLIDQTAERSREQDGQLESAPVRDAWT